MTHTHTFLQHLARFSLVTAAIAVVEPTSAQTPRYRFTDLWNLGAAFNPDVRGTIGINNKGPVVYGYAASGVHHARFWLPQADYGFAANTLHTLDSSGNDSIARDINEVGKIAGVSGGFAGSGSKATVWSLASGSITPTLLGTGPSAAHALSNDSPPHVVGWREIEDDCGLSTESDQAFLWVVGSAPVALTAEGTFEDEFSSAYDIRRNGDDITVGLSEPCGRLNACIEPFEGTAWTGTSGSIMSVGSIRSGADHRESRPYGINDAAKIAGWVFFDPAGGPVQCFPSAGIWTSPGDTSPIDLSAFLANPYDTSRAYALNSLADPQVVGANEVTETAILWEYASEWSSLDLSDSGSPNFAIAACVDTDWGITEAHDINDNGWIVAFGETNGASGLETHVVLLTPEPCPLDVNGDGFITEDDAAAIASMIVLYDPPERDCFPATICDWDVDFDCVIDEDDHAAVLAFIGGCQVEPCPCEGGNGFGPGEGLSIERYALALAALEPELTSEQTALAWQWFFEVYYQYH
jgi:uncharacterized membrane protein